jgi:gliding motility-associated lipoprotein GldH
MCYKKFRKIGMYFMAKKYCKKITLALFIAIALLGGCNNVDLFEKNISIPDIKWKNNFAATGQFNIADTTAFYNIYIVIRHTDAYQYNNIWLNVGLQAAGDSMITQKLNLPLGSDALGWEGVGMNDIWEVRKLITRIPLKKNSYNFSITQIMRDNPLLYIMSAGLRIEKAI